MTTQAGQQSRVPVLLHFVEPALESIEIVGKYNAETQLWETEGHDPHVPTTTWVARPTVMPTNVSGRPDTYEETDREPIPDA